MAAEAEAEYRGALIISPEFTPAVVNLADCYRALGRDWDGEQVLRAALAASSGDRAGALLPYLRDRTAFGRAHRRRDPGA
ncbi:tetratricopeptide repeat protein [Sinorhizobium meliloti]|uniref:tetratricopeptide repeat protein n=1 Tax=Rhizobium meliloti TaxID=382 RepID=UPI002D79D1E3|nr:tetratricopeptide repeat protein [Sinorhizobium meliloti]